MIGRSIVIKFIISGLLVFGFGIVVLNFISYNRRQTDSLLAKTQTPHISHQHEPDISNRIKADFRSDTQPAQLTADKTKINIYKDSIRKYKISINNDKEKDIAVLEAGKGNYHVLLLHGQGSSSKVWEDIGTLQYLSQWGYRAYAITIPSNREKLLSINEDKEAVQWLTKLINKLRLKNLVIISPSMSGRLSLPYIFQLDEKQRLIQGLVAIAPVGTEKFLADDYKQIKIPTLIVHGENDVKFESAFKNLQQIPTSEILLIKDASHGSYYEKPIEFHNKLRQFLYNIYRPIYKNHFVPDKTKMKIKKLNQ